MAREERNQDRRAATYVDLMAVVGRHMRWARDAVTPGGPKPPAEIFDAIESDEQFLLRARVEAFGSKVMQQLMTTWTLQYGEFWRIAVECIERSPNEDAAKSDPTLLGSSEELTRVRLALRSQVWNELNEGLAEQAADAGASGE
ncbi:MAG: hypothetical protein ACT4PI_11820 [Actinomycetota bacterium]